MDRSRELASSAARMMRSTDGECGRHALRVRGTVQGVGFRPAVYRLARHARLAGFVRNDSEGVWIEIEGKLDSLAEFPDTLRRGAPPLSRIDAIETTEIAFRGEREFYVAESQARAQTRAIVPADAATCDACVRELFDPRDRRYRYPFINCTDCGPRYTIVRDVPYDRAKTTMDAFAMCDLCRAEYDDPGHRRFHAEPNACAVCGPRVALVASGERVAEGDGALAFAARLLEAGKIVCVKGLGGYQLAVDATNEDAVQRLRARKQRPDKPFALMARDLAVAAAVAHVSDAARDALVSSARPIVLLPARGGELAVAAGVAPGLRERGVMLPATPLHHLLLAGDLALLVMTSANRAEEPMAKDDADAQRRLRDVADAFLVHDRAIHTRADDSVVRVVAGAARPVRRARGFVPDPIALGFDAPSVLAVGAELKSTICVTRGSEAYLSQHVGDLQSLQARAFFLEVIAKLTRLLAVEPAVVVHDVHPDYASTRWALLRGLPCVAVQHHHAHVAACLAEHARTGPVIGVAFDGTGCGPEGDLWGGEILIADLRGFHRIGHLQPIALAGGEAAIHQPWRLALAALIDAGEPYEALLARVAPWRREAVRRMIAQAVSAPMATGAGRWFDAVAALVGVRDAITYEGQAAIELEALAAEESEADAYPFVISARPGRPFVVDLRPTVRAVAADVRCATRTSRIAARFHTTLACSVIEACRCARRDHALSVVALSGGCFQNRLLTDACTTLLARDGFEVLVHRRVPPNDGGIALGQAAVAAYRMTHP